MCEPTPLFAGQTARNFKQERLMTAFRMLQNHPDFDEMPNSVMVAVAYHMNLDLEELVEFADQLSKQVTAGNVETIQPRKKSILPPYTA